MNSNTLHFCTLFDSNYMSRGVVMYQSLRKCELNFHLYIFAFDDNTVETIQLMQLEKVTVVSLKEFEDVDLLRIKDTRSKGEYCWTCTSSTIAYCIDTFQLQNCTYVDADLFFYESPRVLIDEIPAEKHVLITEHRYTRYYDQSKVSGKYCVQFMYFDNSEASKTVLNNWRNQCINWCYNRIEDGKFGDQKYLDTWTTQYSCVHELQNIGGGLAPWNIQRYQFSRSESGLMGEVLESKQQFKPIFFHFHGLKFYSNGSLIICPNTYRIKQDIKTLFYVPYIDALAEARQQIAAKNDRFDSQGTLSSKTYLKDRYIKGKFAYIVSNVFKNIFHI